MYMCVYLYFNSIHLSIYWKLCKYLDAPAATHSDYLPLFLSLFLLIVFVFSFSPQPLTVWTPPPGVGVCSRFLPTGGIFLAAVAPHLLRWFGLFLLCAKCFETPQEVIYRLTNKKISWLTDWWIVAFTTKNTNIFRCSLESSAMAAF